MILLFDVGNSQIKWCGLSQEGDLVPGGQHPHKGLRSQGELDEIWDSLSPPSAVWGICVAAQSMADTISHWTHTRWGVESRLLTAGKQMGGVTNGYLEPERLGADRWMALLGAGQLYQGASCVADCGTATTVDCLDVHHHHIGGVIIPGLAMMPGCVAENTARVAVEHSKAEVLGRDTSTCLAAGALHAVAGTLERIAAIMDARHPDSMKRIITGGDAARILPWLSDGWHHEPDLVFIGLASAIKNTGGNN